MRKRSENVFQESFADVLGMFSWNVRRTLGERYENVMQNVLRMF
jgi:hypothetical protein